MKRFNVAEVQIGKPDALGCEVLAIYAKYDETYAVYRTSERVSVEFADDEELEGQQRRAIVPLSPVRAEITGLINGWRSDPRYQSVTMRYDRGVGNALHLALEGDLDGATRRLEAIRKEIFDERTTRARLFYMAWAAGLVVLVGVVAAVCTSSAAQRAFNLEYESDGGVMTLDIWMAIFAGALGAFFSVAIAIRDRSVRTDLQMVQNVLDAVLRITIGAIAAMLLVTLLRCGLIDLKIGGQEVISKDRPWPLGYWPGTLIIGFIAGFSERLVSDILDGATAGTAKPAPAPSPLSTGSPPGAKNIAEANDLSGTPGSGAMRVSSYLASASLSSASASARSEEQDIDGCDVDPAVSNVPSTPDDQLPPATGAVAKS